MGTTIPAEVSEQAARYGVQIEGEVGPRLALFLDRLLETNRSFNLTSVTEPELAWHKHILDSLSLVPAIKARPDLQSVVDVGSGGGLPALPLAIALPQHGFTLLESIGKKARFLADVSAELGLRNVQVVETRAESYGQAEGRERFDVATSRAVSRLPVLLELTLPLVRVGGLKLALKGEQAERELGEAERALALLGGAFHGMTRTDTGTVVVIDKLRPTPQKYPRRPGEPKRAPLR